MPIRPVRGGRLLPPLNSPAYPGEKGVAHNESAGRDCCIAWFPVMRMMTAPACRELDVDFMLTYPRLHRLSPFLCMVQRDFSQPAGSNHSQTGRCCHTGRRPAPASQARCGGWYYRSVTSTPQPRCRSGHKGRQIHPMAPSHLMPNSSSPVGMVARNHVNSRAIPSASSPT